MERPTTPMLRIGDWCVNPASGQISRNGDTVGVEARTMRLLLCLAGHAGEVVSIDELLNQVWSGVSVTPDSAYQAVATLRRVLGDNPKHPTYIATVPRLGYRMVAAVTPWADVSSEGEHPEPLTADPAEPAPRLRAGFALVAGVALFLAFGLVFVFRKASLAVAQQPPKSIAVLPFLDLTQGMKQEEFADGMTEELIDKLSKIQGLRVASPTSSFFFKGKQIPVTDIAKMLRVAYVFDGSVRKSGPRLRVAVRLIRADNVYVVWSESYDRPWHDILTVQDDIAGEVTKALRASIEGTLGQATR